ncbi:hypothetical protein ACH42_09785 [Endozoicomonas sp. (ex Bugula neritina AB1)]|nr:hypothetical protein ACH42_09785 [Endozoicomonas sp. (ex Bugula neritina AB1)]
MSNKFNDLSRQSIEELGIKDHMNVYSLAGLPQPEPEPEGFAGARVIAHKDEQLATLVDLCARQAQQLRDELDFAVERGEERPDLEALLYDCDQVLSVQEAV